MSRKVPGIVGSYRKGGTIDQVVSEVLAAAGAAGAEVEKRYLLDSHIEFCTNCRRCTQEPGPHPGPCIHQDEMSGIIAVVEEADALAAGQEWQALDPRMVRKAPLAGKRLAQAHSSASAFRTTPPRTPPL